ncbi:hypothetical protein ABMX62_20170 [Vibrio vulnificus]|uniref:hypothetical protein n=1 Tax=Vibrio vulnificus TaxID=672 RepID=UPI004059413D
MSATETLTKRTLLNILENVDLDAPIEVNVFLEHITKDGKVKPITRLRLSTGAGLGGKDNSVLLSTTPTKS